MKQGKQTTTNWHDKPDAPFLERVSSMHPHQMLLYGAILGIIILFVGLEALFLLNTSRDGTGEIGIPLAFYASTAILFVSSFVIKKASNLYKSGNMPDLLKNLSLTLGLGFIFCALQIVGWAELYSSAVFLQGKPAGAFLYVISGVHVIHIVGGMAFLAIACFLVSKKMADPVDTLIYETSPYELLRLKMLARYWHVMDIIWLVLFFTFCLVF